MPFSDTTSSSALRVVIPARYGSSRLPGKPLIDLAGKPMVVRVFEAVRAALPDVDAVVAIDDERVQQVLEKYAVPFVMTNATHESGTDRAAQVAGQLGWADHDIVINVQGDEPLIPVELLRSFSEFCLKRSAFEMATISAPMDSVEQIQNPNIVKLTVDSQGNAIVFSRAPVPFDRDAEAGDWDISYYLRHIGIYAYRHDILRRLTQTPPCTLEQLEKLEQLRALWLDISIHVMAWHESPPHGVDTPDDALRVIHIFSRST